MLFFLSKLRACFSRSLLCVSGRLWANDKIAKVNSQITMFSARDERPCKCFSGSFLRYNFPVCLFVSALCWQYGIMIPVCLHDLLHRVTRVQLLIKHYTFSPKSQFIVKTLLQFVLVFKCCEIPKNVIIKLAFKSVKQCLFRKKNTYF